MTPELNPCFYFISVRGFDRILIISTILFGGFYHIANRVKWTTWHWMSCQHRKISKEIFQDPDEEYCGSVGLKVPFLVTRKWHELRHIMSMSLPRSTASPRAQWPVMAQWPGPGPSLSATSTTTATQTSRGCCPWMSREVRRMPVNWDIETIEKYGAVRV